MLMQLLLYRNYHVFNRTESYWKFSIATECGQACVLEFSIPVDSIKIYSFRQCFDRVCTVPWCRCVTPLPSTFLFIYRWLVTFFHVLHTIRKALSVKRQQCSREVYGSAKLPSKKKQQLFPQLFQLFYTSIISLLLPPAAAFYIRNTSFHSL